MVLRTPVIFRGMKKMKIKTWDLEQSRESTSGSIPEEDNLSDYSEYSFRNARLIFKTDDTFDSTELEKQKNNLKLSKPPEKVSLKRTESMVTKMVEKCVKAVGDLATNIKLTLKGNVRRCIDNESGSVSSSFDDNSGVQLASSTEMDKKYSKLLNNERLCQVQTVQGSDDHRRRPLLRQADVEGVELEKMPYKT